MAVATKVAPKATTRAKAPAKPKAKAVVEATPKQTPAQFAATALYNRVYEGFVRMASDAHRISGDDLVLAHSVARLRVRAAVKTGQITCPRCGGTQIVNEFSHLDAGRCFMCTDAKKEVVEAVA